MSTSVPSYLIRSGESGTSGGAAVRCGRWTLGGLRPRPRPNSDAFVLAWLVREILAEGADDEELRGACVAADVSRLRRAVAPFDLQTVSSRTGVDEADLVDLVSTI